MTKIKVILNVKKVSAGGKMTLLLNGEPQLDIDYDSKTGRSEFKPAKVKGKRVKSKIAIMGPVGYLPTDLDSDKFADFSLEGDPHIVVHTVDAIFKEFSMTVIDEGEITITPQSIYYINSEIFFSDGTPEKSEHRISTTTDPKELSFIKHWSKKLDELDIQKSEEILRKFVKTGLMAY